jgi:hypothetical protein
MTKNMSLSTLPDVVEILKGHNMTGEINVHSPISNNTH